VGLQLGILYGHKGTVVIGYETDFVVLRILVHIKNYAA